MSAYESSSTCIPTGDERRDKSETQADATSDNASVPVTDSDMEKLRKSAKIHAESLSLLGQ